MHDRRAFRSAAVAASVATACLLAPGVDADPVNPAALILLSADVVKVEAARPQGGFALGSGVLVAPDRVVTNCHVTREATAIEVVRLGERHPVASQAADLGHDLCVLQTPGLGAPQITIGRASRLRVGQPLTALGFTGGFGLQASSGEVIALHKFDAAPVIQSTSGFNSGASGGGLFDERQQLVGILTFRMRGADAHYFAAPVEWLEPMLAPGAAYEPVHPLSSRPLPYWQRPRDEQPAFLQAASLAQAGQWQALQDLAARWSQVSMRNPQPWFSLGLAAEGLDHSSEAVVSFQRAVAIDPDFATGWLRLGLLYARLGQRERASEVRTILAPLNAAFAAQLAERL